jgi:hypothetical protein
VHLSPLSIHPFLRFLFLHFSLLLLITCLREMRNAYEI